MISSGGFQVGTVQENMGYCEDVIIAEGADRWGSWSRGGAIHKVPMS